MNYCDIDDNYYKSRVLVSLDQVNMKYDYVISLLKCLLKKRLTRKDRLSLYLQLKDEFSFIGKDLKEN